LPDRGLMAGPGRRVVTAATVVASMKSLWALGVVGVISRGRIEQAAAKRKRSDQLSNSRLYRPGGKSQSKGVRRIAPGQTPHSPETGGKRLCASGASRRKSMNDRVNSMTTSLR
jgi:hypothetical protein